MDNFSPGSELSESFLTPPKPYIMISEGVNMSTKDNEERGKF